MGIDAEALLLTRPLKTWRLCSWAMELPRSSLGSKYSLLFHLLESPGAIDGWVFMDFWGSMIEVECKTTLIWGADLAHDGS
jgi:hypothetical protein